MLLRIVFKDFIKTSHSYKTKIVCTSCGHQLEGTSYKTDSLTTMSLKACTNCGVVLENQELLNKSMAKRLEYHES